MPEPPERPRCPQTTSGKHKPAVTMPSHGDELAVRHHPRELLVHFRCRNCGAIGYALVETTTLHWPPEGRK